MPITKIALASLAGGVTLFVWGALSHSILPFSESALHGFKSDDAVTRAILENAPTSGIYFLPYIPQKSNGMPEEQFEATRKSAEEKMQQGPFVLASVRLGPMGLFGNYLTIQLLTDILTALLVCLILVRTKDLVFKNAVVTSMCTGLTGFAAITLPEWNWYAFSTAFTLAELFDIIVGFFLGGSVMAWILGRRGKSNLSEPVG